MKRKTSINGERWTYKIVSIEEMMEQREDGDEIAGLCVPSEKTIYIEEDSLDFETVLHETYHAYFHYLYLEDTTELKLSDLEEISAVLFCKKGTEIIKKAKEMYKKLQKKDE